VAHPDQGSEAVVSALLDVMLLYIVRAWLDGEPATVWAAALGDPAITAALHHIHQEPARQWTVEGLRQGVQTGAWCCPRPVPSAGAASGGTQVRAVVYDRYGLPDVLRVDDLPKPSPAAGQVLVEVAATSINLSDWECLLGTPLYSRIGGLRSPARRTLGSDIAGVVDAVGPGVTRFRPGDEVYGDNLALKGGFAEYAIAPETALAAKPAALTFAQASTIPQAGVIAWQGTAGAAAGRRVLINGAGGGSGSFAIPLAKRLGAHVTGVDNAGKLDFMRSLGADDVIDYRGQDFTREGPYDLILDLVAHRSVFAYRRALAPGGRYRCVGGSVRTLLRVLTVGSLAGLLTRRRLGVLAVKEGPAHFQPVADLCVAGDLGIHIDRTFTLAEVPAALAHVGEGRALGKVVVEVS
jgi:NADPH:quinone reductase-like Zn-dependent oxidoreductase